MNFNSTKFYKKIDIEKWKKWNSNYDFNKKATIVLLKLNTYVQIIHIKPNAFKVMIKLASVALMSLAELIAWNRKVSLVWEVNLKGCMT